MNDSYHTIGATKDRAAKAAREQIIIDQLTRIADALERLVGPDSGFMVQREYRG